MFGDFLWALFWITALLLVYVALVVAKTATLSSWRDERRIGLGLGIFTVVVAAALVAFALHRTDMSGHYQCAAATVEHGGKITLCRWVRP